MKLAFIFITNVHAVDDIGIDFADKKITNRDETFIKWLKYCLIEDRSM